MNADEQLKLYETIIDGVCEALGVTPTTCSVVELDDLVHVVVKERNELRAGKPTTEECRALADMVDLARSRDGRLYGISPGEIALAAIERLLGRV